MPNQDVIDLIVKPENLPWALEIEGAMGEAKTQLLRKFWRGVDQALRSQLAELDLTTEFSVEGLSSLERDPRPKTRGVFLVQKGITPDRAHLKLGVFHEEAMIFPGIAFSHQQPVPNPLSEVRALCDALPESWRDLSDWWVGWREPGSNPKLNSGEFLHKVAIDCKAVAEAMTEALWDILWNQLGRIRSANRALQAAPSSG